MAREALTVIGYAVGSTFGGPIGAAIGATIGGYIGGIIDPQQIPGPGLNEAPVQTSRDGVPIPIIWGVHVTHGNIIQKVAPYEVTTTESAGKGAETTETRRYQTFAIGVCQGPIDGISKIWQNDKLVYATDGSVPTEDQAAFEEHVTIYTGTEEQNPDPNLEADTGVGNQPYYRGLAYIVMADFDITEFGSAIPQYKFEVNGSRDATVISKPYPIEAIDGAALTFNPGDDQPNASQIEGAGLTFTLQDSTLRQPLQSYSYEDEGADLTFLPQDSTLRAVLETTDHEDEGADLTFTPQDGTIRTALVQHDYEDEGAELSFTPQDGTLI